MKVGKYYIQCSWETTSPFWPMVHLDFLQTASSPLKGNLFPQDLRIYDFVPLIFIVMCCDKINLLTMLFSNIGSFCGEDIEGSTQSEEALSSSKSRGH